MSSPPRNTFSWTFPDHPLHQQYPLVQVGAWLLVESLGMGALSLLCGAGWLAGMGVWMRWSGPAATWSREPLLWLAVAVGVSRHAVQRPEIVTVLGLGVLLVAYDAWRRGHRTALVALPITLWIMVNSHQLFIVGVALLALLVVDVAVQGRVPGFAGEPRTPPWGPLALAVGASLLVLMVSPLGPGVYLAPFAMVSTLLEHGQGCRPRCSIRRTRALLDGSVRRPRGVQLARDGRRPPGTDPRPMVRT